MPNCSIEAIVMTYNEELNIERCISSLRWTSRIVIIDNFSTDKTIAIARKYPSVTIYQRPFDDFSSQRNFMLHGIQHHADWVFMLDADEVCPPELREEIITRISENSHAIAFNIRRKDYWDDVWLKRSSLYPEWYTRVFKPSCISFSRIVHEKAQCTGPVDALDNHIHHYPFFKGIDQFVQRHLAYASCEAQIQASRQQHLHWHDFTSSDPNERRRFTKTLWSRLSCRWLLYILYHMFCRWSFLDGEKGIHFVMLKAFYEYTIELKKKIIEGRL
jgi:glycosyltransferase involved in cell wall biosynthesis